MNDKVYCRMVDGLPGEPCKTCGRIVVRKGSGKGMYRLTHEKAAPVVAEQPAQWTATPVPAGVSIWCRDCFNPATLVVSRVPFCDKHAELALDLVR